MIEVIDDTADINIVLSWGGKAVHNDKGPREGVKKLFYRIKYKLIVDEAHHSAHDNAKKNSQQLSLVQPEKTHHLPKDRKCDN